MRKRFIYFSKKFIGREGDIHARFNIIDKIDGKQRREIKFRPRTIIINGTENRIEIFVREINRKETKIEEQALSITQILSVFMRCPSNR